MTMHKPQYGKNPDNIDKDEYRTPDWVFDPLHAVLDFTLDVAATPFNTKLPRFFTKEQNALQRDWTEETVFANPPYTNGQYGDWIDYACMEYLNNTVTTAMIVPFNPETKAFRPVWDFAHYLIVPKKRIAFLLPDGVENPGASFPTCIPIFTYQELSLDDRAKLRSLGYLLDLHRAFAL